MYQIEDNNIVIPVEDFLKINRSANCKNLELISQRKSLLWERRMAFPLMTKVTSVHA
jgi:hypothetical protein